MLKSLDKSDKMIAGTHCGACFSYLSLVLLYALDKA